MKPFSRNMPKVQNPPGNSLMLTIVSFALVGLLIYVMVVPFFIWGAKAGIGYALAALSIFIFTWPSHLITKRKLNSLVQARPNDSICTFARSFDRRKVDPWVIRAVYENIQLLIPEGKGAFPLRPEDRLFKDLYLDEDDIDLDMFEYLPKQIGRVMENLDNIPIYGNIRTVADLVMLFNALPIDPSFEGNIT